MKRPPSKQIRAQLKARDNEICAKCGRDCALVKRIIDHAGVSICFITRECWKHYLHPYYYILRHFGFTPYKHTWESDHIIELRDGGDNSLENFQTLCLPCHKEKTNDRPFFNAKPN